MAYRLEPFTWGYTDAEHRAAELLKEQVAEQAETIRILRRVRDDQGAERENRSYVADQLAAATARLEERTKQRDELKAKLGDCERRVAELEGVVRENRYQAAEKIRLASACETSARDNKTIEKLIKQRDEARKQRDLSLQEGMSLRIDLASARETSKTLASEADKRLREYNETLRKLGDANAEINSQKRWLDSVVALQKVYLDDKIAASGALARIHSVLLTLPHAHEAPEEDLCIRCRIERAMDGRS